MNKTLKTASSVTLTALSLMLAAAAFAADAPAGSKGKAIGANDTVHCYNIHDCKGNSDCATAESACKGQNACKGHGFKAAKAGACLTAGGVIADIK
jgi:hypothetical protein